MAGAVFKGLTLHGAGHGFKITQVRVSCFPERVWNAGSGMGHSSYLKLKDLLNKRLLVQMYLESPCRMLCPFPFLLLSACRRCSFSFGELCNPSGSFLTHQSSLGQIRSSSSFDLNVP